VCDFYHAVEYQLFFTDHEHRSLISCFKLATGTQDDAGHAQLLQADPGIANVYFLSFIFVVVSYFHNCAILSKCEIFHFFKVFVLFNILLAIIVDAYGGAAEESRESISIAEDVSASFNRLLYKLSVFKGSKTMSSERLAQAVSKLTHQARFIMLPTDNIVGGFGGLRNSLSIRERQKSASRN
jgi:hypothetical protein